MKYDRSLNWELKTLKDIAIINPEEELQKGIIVKHVNLDKLEPNNKFILGYDISEFNGKGRKFRNCDVIVPQISTALLAGKTALVTILDDNEVGAGSSWYIVLRAINQVTDPDYLYYLAISPRFRDLMIQTLEGRTSSQYVNLSTLVESQWMMPPYNEQCVIARTLSSIDAKIKKNTEVCHSLEETLEQMFYYWFVAYNFPDDHGQPYLKNGGAFFQSDLGPIPIGWKTGNLSDIGNIIAGATPSRNVDTYYTQNGIPWITPKDISRLRRKFIGKGAIDLSQEGFNSCSTSLLPRGTVLFSSRAPIGYIAIATNELTTNQGFRSLIPFSHIGSAFSYYLLLHKTPEITSMASGTTFMEISGQTLKKLKIIIPDTAVLQAFQEQSDCFMQYQENLEKENQLLEAIRSKLLSLLMTGVIRIPTKD